MTESPYRPLGDILGRLEPLLSSRGLSHDDALDLDELSASTGLTKREIHTLLKGGRLRERPVEKITRSRVNSLYAKRHEGDDRKKAVIIAEVADRLGVSKVWARQLLQGDKCPNVPHLKALSTYFGVPVTFFTDSAPDALARELGPIVSKWEDPDPLAELMKEFGIREVHARSDDGSPLSQQQKARIAAIVRLVIGEEESQW
ncbi:helix-turn-helix transcriptional regulator [Streptomyces macrosporus]|uniref:HTH cro/C1-type domain-containing protein n=1 Tax=Streptomyces macrosporus TaxID=44032 RepID=A0ABN3JZH9_9ACTN